MGNIIRKGIAAYQQTMSVKSNEPAEKAEPTESAAEKAPKTTGNALPPKKPPDTQAGSVIKPDGLLKTTVVPPEETKARRVAKFLILVGSEQAAKILAKLDPQQVEEISREIASIQGIGGDEAESVLTEFQSLLTSPSGYMGTSSGGPEAARRILYAVYGPEKGEALLNKAVPETKENIFGFLEEFEPEQMVFLLKDERPAASALVLARLPPKVSAETLQKFPAALKPEILKCIAHQSEVSPEVLESVAAVIREKARFLGSGGSKDIAIDGMQTLTDILKQGDYAFGDRIISELETEDPDIGKDLKDRLYTLDDVLAAYDRPLAQKLAAMSEQDIAILLKGRSSEFCAKILSNVSARRRDLIREEGEIMGPVPKRDCDEAANEFLVWFRQAREKGELPLVSDEDWV